MSRPAFQQLSFWADGPTSSEYQHLQNRCTQLETILQQILSLAQQSAYRGRPTPLAQEILRLAAQHQGEV